MSWKVPLSDLDFGEEEEQAVMGVLKSKWLTMGEVTQAFEREFEAYLGARHALAVSSCTAALHMACLAAGLGPGDEAILPSLTFVATANAIAHAVHAAIGVTEEFDLQLYSRRLKQWQLAYGSEDYWSAQLGRLRAGSGCETTADFIRDHLAG